MGFKEWVLANPARTKEYNRLKSVLEFYTADVAKNEKRLANVTAGVMPEWANPEPKQEGILGMFSIAKFMPDISELFSFVSPYTQYQKTRLKAYKCDSFQIQYWEHEYNKAQKKKRKQSEWERKALEADRDKEITLNVERESAEREIARGRNIIAEKLLEIENFKVDESIFDWYGKGFNPYNENWDRLVTCLNNRLFILGADELSHADGNLSDMLNVAAHYPLSLWVEVWNVDGYWFVKLFGQDGFEVIRQQFDGITGPHEVAFVHALLAYIDQHWDVLIKRVERVHSRRNS
jgi:hypothetical protein